MLQTSDCIPHRSRLFRRDKCGVAFSTFSRGDALLVYRFRIDTSSVAPSAGGTRVQRWPEMALPLGTRRREGDKVARRSRLVAEMNIVRVSSSRSVEHQRYQNVVEKRTTRSLGKEGGKPTCNVRTIEVRPVRIEFSDVTVLDERDVSRLSLRKENKKRKKKTH